MVHGIGQHDDVFDMTTFEEDDDDDDDNNDDVIIRQHLLTATSTINQNILLR